MRKRLCALLVLFIGGCGDDGTGYPNYSPYSPYSPYTGLSSYFKTITGTSNLTSGYKDPPVLDVNDPLVKLNFKSSAEDYLDGVANDLEEINDKAENAAEKINAVTDAFNSGFEYFSVRHVGPVFTLHRVSNFGIRDYPDFPDFSLFHFPPTKPRKPLFLDDEFAVESYNRRVGAYNREVADFAATVKAYTEDARHYIANCENDHREIRKKGLSFLRYIESLSTGADGTTTGLEQKLSEPPDLPY